MNLELQKQKFRALNDWFLTPQGLFVQEEILDQMILIRDRLRGTTFLQLGSCGQNTWLDELPFRRCWLTTPSDKAFQHSLISSIQALPMERGSVDCVMAPFTLELCAPERQFIYEIDRILKPMGHVIFIGINPFSLWGGALKLGWMKHFESFKTTLTSSLTLKQLMFAQGYRLTSLKTFCYVPPLRSQNMLSNLRFLDEMGKMIILSPAGFYCLVVQKHQYATPKPLFQKKRQLLNVRGAATGLARESL